jgi:AcrR family transcriptional regulator
MPASHKRQGSVLEANRREDLLRAAARLFVEKGFDATTTRDIAEAVGMRSGSPFYHFRSKQDLLKAAMIEGLEAGHRRLQSAVAGIDDPEQRLRVMIRGHLGNLLEGDCHAPMLLYESRSLGLTARAEIAAVSDRYQQAWQATLEQLARHRPRRVTAPFAPRTGIEARPGKPAISIASRLWQAVTPEPQDMTACSGSIPASRARNSRRSSAAGRKQPSASRLSRKKRLRAPGYVPADRVEGFVLATEAIRAAGVDQAEALALQDQRARRHCRHPVTQIDLETRRGNFGDAVDSGLPSATQRSMPPSSTATRSWPSQRSNHHSRLAIMPPASS